MRTREEAFWDRLAKHFDWLESKDAPINARIVELTRRHLAPGDTVLDCGCGTGTAALALAGGVGRVVGIDLSRNMIERATAKCAAAAVTNCSFLHGTIEDPALRERPFDAVLAFYLLHLLDDAPRFLRAARGLLKPGGLLVSATPCLERTSYGVVLPLAGRLHLVPPIALFSVTGLERLMTDGGLELVESVCLHDSGKQQFIVARKPARGAP
ncbi:MAG: class I SAM-dependent methyltransferase [Anaeromyxobacter sp.]